MDDLYGTVIEKKHVKGAQWNSQRQDHLLHTRLVRILSAVEALVQLKKQNCEKKFQNVVHFIFMQIRKLRLDSSL